MSDAPDFPAAHSMDTNWFAVDAEGNVGLFASDEAGAKPKGIRGDEYGVADTYVLNIAIAHALKTGQLKLGHHLATDRDDLFTFALCILRDTCEDRPDYSEPLPGNPELAVTYMFMSPVDQFHSDGKCHGCCALDHLMFVYRHTDQLHVAVPYKRDISPPAPINTSDWVNAQDSLTDFHTFSDFRFSDRTQIQPLEHSACDVWSNDVFLTAGGNVEVVPAHSRNPNDSAPAEYQPSLTHEQRVALAKTLIDILNRAKPHPENRVGNSGNPDFPAAHSMDTTWFGVDSEGNVGVFHTDEDGAVPKPLTGDQYGGLDESFCKVAISHAIKTGALKLGQHLIEPKSQRPAYSLVITAASRDRGGEDYSEPLLGHPDLWVDYAMFGVADYLHESNLCLGCCSLEHILYLYRHAETSIPAPYQRRNTPAQPLKVEHLPQPPQPQVELHRFTDFTFSTRKHVQPIEHTPCQTAGAGEYFSTSGNIEPLPEHSRDPDIDYSHPISGMERLELEQDLRKTTGLAKTQRRWWKFW